MADEAARDQSLRDVLTSIAATKAELARLDPLTFPVTRPGAPPLEHELDDAEGRLGVPLDPEHRGLLTAANGWDDFFLGVRLLAAHELGQGQLWDSGQMLLDVYFGDGPVPADFPPRAALLPVAVGVDVASVHALWIGGPLTAGGHAVLWLADEEIDRFPDILAWVHGAGRQLHHYLEEHHRSTNRPTT